MLANTWADHRRRYDFVVVGSGYGGAIAAARLASAPSGPSVCVLERGREWPVGSFPDDFLEISSQFRTRFYPLGLYELLGFEDISVLQGCGLGGTSLVNANVAIVPDEEVFAQAAWPRTITRQVLEPFYRRASSVLSPAQHPRARGLLKVEALRRRAQEIGRPVEALTLTVNFDRRGKNRFGVAQEPCIDCGDCVTGCNVGAKNTVAMNYLPLAKRAGAHLFTEAQVDRVEKVEDGWRLHGRYYHHPIVPSKFTLDAGHVILAAGSLGTTEILLRSRNKGLPLSPTVGTRFSGNGDFFGLAYNGDGQTNVPGFGYRPDHPWRSAGCAPGPTIVGGIRYHPELPYDRRITVEDFSFPSGYLGAVMSALGVLHGEDTDVGDERAEVQRHFRNNPFEPYDAHNALNHTMLYLVMGHDNAQGTIRLRTEAPDAHGKLDIDWDAAGRQAVFTRITEELRQHARALGAHFVANPEWNLLSLRHLVTAHPLGGCPLGEDYEHGTVDEFGRVFSFDGRVHQGLFVADGALIPSALGVNPFMTIAALAERIADRIVRSLRSG